MRAEIISIGTELLMGRITDTNAQWLAQELAPLGIDLFHITQVGDNLGRLTGALVQAWERSDLVITTGGLGPTEDDLTREATAALLGETPEVDPVLEEELRAWFGGRGLAMPERNIKQAWRLPSVEILPNPRGTAPGWFTSKDGKVLVSMPGVPVEMTRMWREEAVPRLRPLLGGFVIASRTLRTIGIGESAVEELLGDLTHSNNPTAATYAKNDGVHVVLTVKARDEATVARDLDAFEAQVRPLLGDVVYGTDADTIEMVVYRLLTERGLSIASMESCTSGLIANALADQPGSSGVFRGGIVAYTEEVKRRYGVPGRIITEFGVVSAEVAGAMAEAARMAADADIGVASTGVAGPGEVDGITAGTVYLAVATEDRLDVKKLFWPRARNQVKNWSTLQALDLVRRRLLDPEAPSRSAI